MEQSGQTVRRRAVMRLTKPFLLPDEYLIKENGLSKLGF